jgi:hypothetical protein
MGFTPLPLIDDFLLPVTMGHALVALFLVSVVGVLPLGSRKVLSLNTLVFGLLFLLTPASLLAKGAPTTAFPYRFLGIVLLIVAPVLFTTARK